MKKIQHKFIKKGEGRDIIPRSTIAFKINIHGSTYGYYAVWTCNNYFKKLRELVMEKHEIQTLVELAKKSN